MVKKVGAAAVYCQGAVTAAEMAMQRAVSKAVEGQGASLKAVWGSQTLHCPDNLPFKPDTMPTSFGVSPDILPPPPHFSAPPSLPYLPFVPHILCLHHLLCEKLGRLSVSP